MWYEVIYVYKFWLGIWEYVGMYGKVFFKGVNGLKCWVIRERGSKINFKLIVIVFDSVRKVF